MVRLPHLERSLQDIDRGIKTTKSEAFRRIAEVIESGQMLRERLSAGEQTIERLQPAIKDWRDSTSVKLRQIFVAEAPVELFNSEYMTHSLPAEYLNSLDYRIEKLMQLRTVIEESPPVSYPDVWFDFWRDPRMPFQAILWLLTVILGSGLVIFWVEKCST